MARRRSFDGEIRTHAYKLWLDGASYQTIYDALETVYKKSTPSIRTIARMVSDFKNLGSDIRILEESWIWTEPDDVIPAEGAKVILEISAYVVAFGPSYTDPPYRPGYPDPVMPLTLREARWIWQVHNAAPELSLHDKLLFAEEFVIRERSHDLSLPDMSFMESGVADDLLCLLRFAPWQSASAEQFYKDMVHEERLTVPPPFYSPHFITVRLREVVDEYRRLKPSSMPSVPLQPGGYAGFVAMANFQEPTLEAALRRREVS